MKYLLTLVLFLTVPHLANAEFQAPVIRAKMSMFSTTVSAGEQVNEDPLGSMLTLQPMVLWNFSSINSRMGIHYIMDFSSNYGFTPISGIGLTGYYYLKGLPASYENTPDDTLVQKSKPGFFTFASFTPVNFNLNKKESTPNAGDGFSFSSLLYEFMLGVGYEYPLRPNALIAVELATREASGGDGGMKLSYSGLGLGISFTTSYY